MKELKLRELSEDTCGAIAVQGLREKHEYYGIPMKDLLPQCQGSGPSGVWYSPLICHGCAGPLTERGLCDLCTTRSAQDGEFRAMVEEKRPWYCLPQFLVVSDPCDPALRTLDREIEERRNWNRPSISYEDKLENEAIERLSTAMAVETFRIISTVDDPHGTIADIVQYNRHQGITCHVLSFYLTRALRSTPPHFTQNVPENDLWRIFSGRCAENVHSLAPHLLPRKKEVIDMLTADLKVDRPVVFNMRQLSYISRTLSFFQFETDTHAYKRSPLVPAIREHLSDDDIRRLGKMIMRSGPDKNIWQSAEVLGQSLITSQQTAHLLSTTPLKTLLPIMSEALNDRTKKALLESLVSAEVTKDFEEVMRGSAAFHAALKVSANFGCLEGDDELTPTMHALKHGIPGDLSDTLPDPYLYRREDIAYLREQQEEVERLREEAEQARINTRSATLNVLRDGHTITSPEAIAIGMLFQDVIHKPLPIGDKEAFIKAIDTLLKSQRSLRTTATLRLQRSIEDQLDSLQSNNDLLQPKIDAVVSEQRAWMAQQTSHLTSFTTKVESLGASYNSITQALIDMRNAVREAQVGGPPPEELVCEPPPEELSAPADD